MNDYVHQVSKNESKQIQQFLYWVAGVTLAFVILVVVAVVTADRWLLLISNDSEREFIAPYAEYINDNWLDDSEQELQLYVETLAKDLASKMNIDADLKIDYKLLNDGPVNAFATLGGYVFVSENMMRAVETESGLAMVLAHEIAHVKQRDPLVSSGRGMLIGMAIAALSGSGDPSTVANLASEMTVFTYSRAQEERADLLALEALNRHYGHVAGATQLFDVLKELQGDAAAESLEILSTHPRLDRRIEYLHQKTAEKGWATLEPQPYPEHIADLVKKMP